MMEKRILSLLEGLSEVESELSSPSVMEDKKRYRDLAYKHKYLTSIGKLWGEYSSIAKTIEDDRELMKTEKDAELLLMLESEIEGLLPKLEKLKTNIESMLVPPDPNDDKNTVVELRAGTGGDEAAIFVGDCVRMYKFYAERKGWEFEALSSSPSEKGGFKEYQFVLSGEGVFRAMQYEGGTHRVQRVPETEAQGRVHTSAITVCVMIEPDEDEKIEVEEKEIRIDTYKSSGAGGQHVNTTDSAVRITHLPTSIVVQCQDERSQIKNRDRAMRLLKTKIAEEMRRRKAQEVGLERSSQVGSGDRSERIRTYNFSQNRVTDHRINLTLYKLEEVIGGDMDDLIQPIISFYYQKKFNDDG